MTSLASFFPDPIAEVEVQAFCSFAVWDWKATPFRPDDHKGRFIAHSVKGDREKLGRQYENLAVGPNKSVIRVNQSNFELVADAWARWAASKIKIRYPETPIVLTPLPTSKAVPGLADYRTLNLARRVQPHLPAGSVVWEGVRFRQERQPVHSGGDRGTIFEDMIFTSPPPDGVIIALDDVYTMGSHLSALVKHLPAERRPEFMVTGGQTVWDQPEQVFKRPAFTHQVYP